ncbi:MAG TPA: tetratricopeptide repeat protein [Vicinamibacterales bacterium]|nr:tetratricopeptide repeat protein [Vicinamibacterales bacterium]
MAGRRPPAPRPRTWWVAAALAVITAVVYAGVQSFGFVNFDDPQYVIDNAHVTAGVTWPGVVWAFTTGHAANWHPITWLSHMLDVTLFGAAAGPAHAVSLLIHVVNVVLLFWWLQRTTLATGRSAVVAALFGVHPMHVESVAWISERKDVLSTCFALLTLLAYTAYVRHPARSRYLVVAAAFALGLMAKPMIVTLPVLLLLVDVWPLERDRRFGALVREKAPLFVLAAASVAVTIVVQQRGGAVADFNPYPLSARVAHVLVSYVGYLGKAVWPSRLAVFYPLPIATSRGLALAALAGLAAITVGVFVRRGPQPYLLVGWLWYVVMLLPVIGLIQIGGQSMADRYTYLSLVGIFIAVVWGVPAALRGVPNHRALVGGAGAIAIAGFGLAAHNQLQSWRDSLSLWTHALEVTTGNYRAENAVGALLVDQGRVADALPHLTAAVRLEPAFAEAHNNLGTALARSGRAEEAMGEYRNALRLEPDLALAHNNLALALAGSGEADDAVAELRQATRLEPSNADFHYNLAVLLERQGQRAAALAELQAALAVQPDHAAAARMLEQLRR